MKTIPEMISGDWHPTPDPTGRRAEFTDWSGNVMKGTVVAVEYEEDRDATLYIEVVEQDGSRRAWDVRASRVTWLDVDRPCWAESEHPLGRWVIFHDDNHVEHCGCIVSVDSCHRHNATLTVLVMEPGFFGMKEVNWRQAKWLPE